MKLKEQFNGECMGRYFNAEQIPMAVNAFGEAQQVVNRHFRLSGEAWAKTPYDVKTLAFLQDHEVKDGAFAHLCKYAYEPSATGQDVGSEQMEFYRVCLQDHIILDAVERANSFIKLNPLLLYIAVHELIHLMRFQNGHMDFHAPEDEKAGEEVIVHHLTRQALKPLEHRHMDMVLDCFSSQFTIGD